MKLNPRQYKFCQEYLKSGNATEAYTIAYEVSDKVANVNAARLLANTSIKEYLQSFYKAMEKQTGVSVEQIVSELSKIAFSSITDVVEDSGTGLKVKALDTLSPNVKAAVSEISESDTQYGKNRKIKMHAKIEALKLLGQHLGMFSDKAPAAALPPVTEKDETEHK